MISVGVIGIGNIGFIHARRIFDGKIKGMRLQAVCDINEVRRAAAAEFLPGVDFFTDYRQLLTQPLDAVIVSVPHPLHSQIAVEAFRHGKHVLVEKPVDITVSKAAELNEIAQKSGKAFAIMFNQRTENLFAQARQIVQSGQLGELKRTTWIITTWYRTQHYYDSGAWRATWSGEGGGVLINQAPHQLDLWQWICGMPESVTAMCQVAKYHRIEVEDSATIYARFPNGAEGVFITSTGEYPGTNRLEIVGSGGKLVIEEGKLKWWKLHQDERKFRENSPKNYDKFPYSYEEIPQQTGISGHQLILQNFADHILTGIPLIAPGREGIRELTIQNAAYLSTWKGSVPVDLPFDPAEYDRLLKERQTTPAPTSHTSFTAPGSDYSQRWQISW